MLFFLCMDYVGAVNMSLRTTNTYQLVYEHDAVLPWEIKTGSRWVSFQDQLAADDYITLMKDELDDLAGHRLRALISI